MILLLPLVRLLAVSIFRLGKSCLLIWLTICDFMCVDVSCVVSFEQLPIAVLQAKQSKAMRCENNRDKNGQC